MLNEKNISKFWDIMKLQEEWIDLFYKENPDYYQYFHHKLPLRIIPEVTIDTVLSMTNWKEVKLENPNISKYSNEDDLVDCHISFLTHCEIGYEDSSEEKRGDWNIFYDQNGCYYKIKGNTSPYDLFMEAFTYWIIGD